MSNNIPSLGTVFVSYAREDRERVRTLVDHLSSQFSIWWDADIEPGTWFRQAIDEQLDEAACVIVVWTKHSVGKQFVSDEANRGLSRGVLVPVVLDKDVKIPVGFGEIQFIDLSDWQQTESAEMAKLVKRVQSLVERGPSPRFQYAPLETDVWMVENSLQATAELRELTARIRSLGEILVPGSAPAADLLGALKEVGNTYRAVNTAITSFITPAVEQGPVDAKPFVEMERGSLLTTIKNGRGHCSRLLAYYGRYGGLRDWLKTKASAEMLANVDEVFSRLGTADGDLFAQLVQIGDLLTSESRAITNLLLAGQEAAARKRILAGRKKLEPLEQQLSTAMNELQQVAESLGYAEPV
ncbi:MAG: hypothetical protein DCC57_00240 [Chloroflexi bacterium]|nr:MAG: hypothetical protein DCC57_00240 [Chloroflexota bacterium]